MDYWDLVAPIWGKVSIYDGGDAFVQQYFGSPEVSRTLFAAHWAQSEVRNGGFSQFFFNITGVLAPEAVVAFRTLGMPRSAAVVEQAMAFFGLPYPREREDRDRAMAVAHEISGKVRLDHFDDLDDLFFELLDTENGGFEKAADRYAAAND